MCKFCLNGWVHPIVRATTGLLQTHKTTDSKVTSIRQKFQPLLMICKRKIIRYTFNTVYPQHLFVKQWNLKRFPLVHVVMLLCVPNVYTVKFWTTEINSRLKDVSSLRQQPHFTQHNKFTTLKQQSIKNRESSRVFEHHWWDPTAIALSTWLHKYLQWYLAVSVSLKQHASHRLWKTGRKIFVVPKKDHCWNASACLVQWCTNDTVYNVISNMLTSLFHQHPLDIRTNKTLLVG